MSPTSFLATAGLGWAAGMRSMTAPAALSYTLAGRVRTLREPARTLGSDRAAILSALAAAGEMVADKLPSTPDRTAPFVLAGRLGSGALVGAGVASARRESLWLGALVGAAVAGASTFAMLRVRQALPEALGVPDLPVALAEDALALGLALASARAALS